ncbi:MAG TPA: protein phosphatase 2C domain-containing protein [Acidimicrobiales bacterium]|nr:protein phosphatase 2C domain-containing protein [Acidimicrobiales bacterium]
MQRALRAAPVAVGANAHNWNDGRSTRHTRTASEAIVVIALLCKGIPVATFRWAEGANGVLGGDWVITTAWGAATDVGRRRAVNEDGYLCTNGWFVVADGMGGHAGGRLASTTALETLAGAASRPAGDASASDVTDAVVAANSAVVAQAERDPSCRGMGTTVSGLVEVHAAGQPHWMVFNVGDSRVYALMEGRLVQLTVDHSEVQELLAAGRIAPGEERSHERRHVVTRVLGTPSGVKVDSWLFPPSASERFLVCSDGLTGELDDGRIAELLASAADPAIVAQRLVDAAVEAGGSDNVTVVVVDGPTASAVAERTQPRGELEQHA